MSTPHLIDTGLNWLFQTTWHTALLAVVVAIIARLFRKRLSPAAVSLLWMLVFIRLIMPALPGSPLSIFALFEQEEAIPTNAGWVPPSFVEPRWAVPTLQVSPAPVVIPPEEPSRVWSIVAIAVWLGGAAGLVAYVMLATIRFSLRLRRNSRPADAQTLGLVQACCQQQRLPAPIVLFTEAVATPALFGALRPRLLLPPSILSQLSPAALRSVILHELEHLRRRHLLSDWIFMLIKAVHWFNPAAWLAHRQIRAARELLCDQSVLATLDEEHSRAYGMTMLTLASGLRPGPAGVPVAAFARDYTLIKQRIEAIAGRRRYLAGLGIVLSIVLGVVFLTKPAEAPAQETDPLVPATPPASAPATAPSEDAANEALRAKLDRNLPEVRFDAIGLGDVVEFLKDVSGVRIVVDWTDLEKAGVTKDTQVSGRWRDVKFSKALEQVLDSAAGGTGKVRYSIENGVIRIATARVPATAPAGQLPENPSVAEMIRVVGELAVAQKYEEALALVDRILVQDPENEYARNVRPLIEDRVLIAQQRAFRDRFNQARPPVPNDPAAVALERTLPEVRFDAIGFGDVIEFMRDVSGANIFVNWGALKAAGIDQRASITTRLRDVKFSKALDVILESAAGSAGKLGFSVDRGVITISTIEDLKKTTQIPYNQVLRYPENWPALAQERDRQIEADRQVRAEDAAALAQLERVLPEVRLDAIGFADVIEFLRDVSGANIFVNWRALEVAGIAKNAPVTARLRETTFAKALETILHDVGGGKVQLGYTVDEGVIAISTIEDKKNVATSQGAGQLDPRGTDFRIPATQPTTAPVKLIVTSGPNWQRPPEAKTDAQVRALFDLQLPEIRFDAIPFADVVDFMRDITGANIFVNWRILEAVGVSRTAPVSARLRDVSFGKALETILRDVGGGKVQLAYSVDEGVITISTAEDLATNVVTNVYDIQDLLLAFDREGAVVDQKQVLDQLLLLITDTVARETWRANQGKIGSIRELGGQLIVTQTPENQRYVARLIAQLRETHAVQIVTETKLIDMPKARAAGIGAADPATGAIVVDDAAIKNLEAPDVKILAAPRLTTFPGQPATIATEANGMTLNAGMQATISADRNQVTMTLASAVNPFAEPALRVFRNTTFSIPDGKLVLVRLGDDGAARERWLAIKATIITQRGVSEDRPTLPSRLPATRGN